MSEQEIQRYIDGLNDVWRLFKRYATSGDPDSYEYWCSIVDSADKLYQKHDIGLVRSLIFESVKELQSLYRKEKKRPG